MALGYRPDLLLAAYAVSLGYKLQGEAGAKIEFTSFNSDGVPHDSLQFVLGDVTVWATARGWRVAREIDGKYEKPDASQFYRDLKPALDAGNRNWRDR